MTTPMTKETFFKSISLINLRFQDLHRDLVEMCEQAVKAGVLPADNEIVLSIPFSMEDDRTDPLYDGLYHVCLAAGHDFDSGEGFHDINDPEGLGVLIIEETEQVNQKVRELAEMVGVPTEELETKVEYYGVHTSDTVQHIMEQAGLMEVAMLVSTQVAVRAKHGNEEEGFDDPELTTKYLEWCAENRIDMATLEVVDTREEDSAVYDCPILGIMDQAQIIKFKYLPRK